MSLFSISSCRLTVDHDGEVRTRSYSQLPLRQSKHDTVKGWCLSFELKVAACLGSTNSFPTMKTKRAPLRNEDLHLVASAYAYDNAIHAHIACHKDSDRRRQAQLISFSHQINAVHPLIYPCFQPFLSLLSMLCSHRNQQEQCNVILTARRS